MIGVLLFTSWSVVVAQEAIVISGSSTFLPIIRQAAEQFEAKGLGKVQSWGGGSHVGIEDLLQGKNSIAMVSRELNSLGDSPLALGAELQTFTIGIDGNAVVVNQDNPLKEMDRKTLRSLLTGEVRLWSQLGGSERPVVTVVKEPGRSIRKQLEQYAGLEGEPLKEDYQVGANVEALIFVGADPDAITFVSIGATRYAQSLGVAVKMLRSDGYEPTFSNILSNRYPLGKRPLNLVTLGNPGVMEQRFIDFLLSREGQEIVKALGYAPLP